MTDDHTHATAQPEAGVTAVPLGQEGGTHGGMPPWVPRFLLYVAIVAIASILALAVFRQIASFIWIVVLALFLSFAMEPAVNWLVAHRWTRFWSTFFAMGLLVLIALGLAFVFVPLLFAQIGAVVGFLQGVAKTLNPLLQEWFGVSISLDGVAKLAPQITDTASYVLGGVLGIVGSFFGFLARMLASAFFTFFFVLDGPKLRRFVCSFLPPDRQQQVLWTWNVALKKTGAYFFSRLLKAAIAGVLAFVVMLILDVPFALPLAVWAGLLSQFIPAVGTYLAAILPLLVAIFVSVPTFVILGVYFLLYQLVENYILEPKITARTMSLHPVVALGSAFVGGALFGAVGAFLALPAAAVVQAGIETYSKRYDVVDDELTRHEASDAGDPGRPDGEGHDDPVDRGNEPATAQP